MSVDASYFYVQTMAIRRAKKEHLSLDPHMHKKNSN
jgi:hypothetical protein